MIERILIKRHPETYVVSAATAEGAIINDVLPVVGEVYDKFKCVSLEATRCHNLPSTFVVVAKYEVELPDDYFMKVQPKQNFLAKS